MNNEFFVDFNDLELFRKLHPDEKTVLVKHCDGVARWHFGVIDPNDSKDNWRLHCFGAYTADGRFMFYDSKGNHHEVLTEKQSKGIINFRELWNPQEEITPQ